MRGKGWGKKHSTVDYVFENERVYLYCYHGLVMSEMIDRGYKVDSLWLNGLYRGKNLDCITLSQLGTYNDNVLSKLSKDETIFKEHDDKYLKECLDNLERKGVELVNGESIAHMKIMLALKGVS